ncbi:MAG TPA: hypothetical protein VGK70_03900 [Thermoanaerobaculia bacterium]
MRRSSPLLLAGLALCCSTTAGLKPISARDSEVPCPGGRLVWNLEIQDQRAERLDSQRLMSLLRESLSHSFPGCQWADIARPDAPTIAIEIHSFAADFDGTIYDATAEWTVLARDASGRTLTEFQAEARVSRPNYRGSNNEREALREALEQAVNRTLAGLRNVSGGS